ncbi:hypothetical protein UFOVP654_77 [uncultured Caudovirales phage]|uniref:Uncharacterized protein n=1 Tax=uncultured Caudovirales phage TaxID=2100421 RepID=A0A6J5NDN5_9CAUD|nr:hypothetical protein UFOVP654_77 [uncultured Caudovirales phage]
MKTVSIGYYREDGDFAVLATLNNNDEHMTDNAFGDLIGYVASKLCRQLVCEMVILERQDTPDYVTIEGEQA